MVEPHVFVEPLSVQSGFVCPVPLGPSHPSALQRWLWSLHFTDEETGSTRELTYPRLQGRYTAELGPQLNPPLPPPVPLSPLSCCLFKALCHPWDRGSQHPLRSLGRITKICWRHCHLRCDDSMEHLPGERSMCLPSLCAPQACTPSLDPIFN